MEKDEVQIMEKYRIDEITGIRYTLRGDYYLPDLYLLQNETPMYGKYGFLRLEYLKECKRVLYINYLTQGKLVKHLNDVDIEATERIEFLIEMMKQQQGITEKLKAQNQFEWVGLMNNIRNSAEEIILNELIYV
jgi:hypothetical protein